MSAPIKLNRYKNNPILTPIPEHKWESRHVSNAGVTVYNGKIYILYRAEGEDMRASAPNWPVARIGLAVSLDGYTIQERSAGPVLDIDGENLPFVDGVEDPRITKIGDTYYIVYVLTSVHGDHIALARTMDFKKFEKAGMLMEDISQRTSGLLPEKIDGEYMLFHRIVPNMWVSYSKDLKRWHSSRIIMRTKYHQWTDCKIGIGAPPVRGKNSWILFFHARDTKGVYRLGIAWLDLKDPSKIIKIQDEPILEPEESYEKNGFVNNVIYTCGVAALGGKYFVYYGCGDQCLAVATVDKESLEI